MRTADFQGREAIQRAFENQVRQRDRGFDRKGDDVGEIAIAFQAVRKLGGHAGGLRVNEHQHAELLHLGPERVKFRIAQLQPVARCADGGTAQPVFPHPVFQLFCRQVRVLQGHRSEGDEALGVGSAGFGQFFVLDLDHLFGDLAFGLVPVGIDRQRLHVDALRIHRRQALRHRACHVQVGSKRWPAELQAHQRHRLRHRAVGMHVDHPGTLAGDRGFAAARLRVRRMAGEQVATDKGKAGERAGGRCKEVATRAHRCLT